MSFIDAETVELRWRNGIVLDRRRFLCMPWQFMGPWRNKVMMLFAFTDLVRVSECCVGGFRDCFCGYQLRRLNIWGDVNFSCTPS
jgi:hypothetical protein